MKKILFLACFSTFIMNLAFGISDDTTWTLYIEEANISSRRISRDIGMQKTVLDTFALRETVSKSMADILSENTSIFIKSYGRATLSTASFRGTAPSHTQVTWNGIKINSPMLGMVDFSQIPSYFIDDAVIYHGASSVDVTGGGLGGAISLSTKPSNVSGLSVNYIQGISSYSTFDEFLRIMYSNEKWTGSTRFSYGSSKNNYKYTNYRKKRFEYDDNKNIVSWEYPQERNKNGSFNDMHIMQEIYRNTEKAGNFGLSVWYMNTKRGIPMLNVDYKEDSDSKNRQNEETVRSSLNWKWDKRNLSMAANTGYVYTDMQYRYLGDNGSGELTEMIHSRSYVNTFHGDLKMSYFLSNDLFFAGNISFYQHSVKSIDRAIITRDGNKTVIGYDKVRAEISGFLSVKYSPFERLGISVNLREELYGTNWTPVIPAGYVEYFLSKKGNVFLKGSIARNYRYPTLNDLYFMPGGNDTLKTEKGFTYDGGLSFTVRKQRIEIDGEFTAYNSYIKDWIVWLPTFKGYWTPVNVRKVHSYGIEAKAGIRFYFNDKMKAEINGNYTVSHSINHGDPINWADESIGKQLVYIPKYSSNIKGKIYWKTWAFTYKWNYYSRRYTTSSNDKDMKIGNLNPYYMNDISLDKSFYFNCGRISLKFAVNNIFNEEYESVLSRPMPGRNYAFFIEIFPKIKR